MMLDHPSALAVRTACVVTPKRAAIAEMVSPRATVYRPPAPTAGAAATAGAAPAADVDSFKTCPGKINDFQLSPLSARTDAVDRPKRPAIDDTLSPGVTVYLAGATETAALLLAELSRISRSVFASSLFDFIGFLGAAD